MKDKFDQIALFGTSADPPTCGHEALLRGLLTMFPTVATWASDNPIKHHGESLKIRGSLLHALVNDINNSNLIFRQDLSSPWTISTLNKASDLWPKSKFTFVIGSDLIMELPNWLRAKEIFQRAKIGIAERSGWPMEERFLNEIKRLGAKIQILPLEIPASSSSAMRKKNELSQIPKVVKSMLLDKQLYGINKKYL